MYLRLKFTQIHHPLEIEADSMLFAIAITIFCLNLAIFDSYFKLRTKASAFDVERASLEDRIFAARITKGVKGALFVRNSVLYAPIPAIVFRLFLGEVDGLAVMVQGTGHDVGPFFLVFRRERIDVIVTLSHVAIVNACR